MPWYYAVDRQQRGPVSEDEFNDLVRTGVIRPDTLVWRPGMPDWREWRAIAPADSAPGSPPPPAPSAPPATNDGDTATCAATGRIRPKSEMIQINGRWVSPEHKDAIGGAANLSGPATLPANVAYASFWARFAAKLLDGLILWVINLVVVSVLALILGSSLARDLSQSPEKPSITVGFILFQIAIQIISLAISLAYSIIFIRKYDATPGKLALGLRLVRADGTSLSVSRIVGRYFAEMLSALILMIGYLMAAFDRDQHRTLHDHLCDTRVIRVR